MNIIVDEDFPEIASKTISTIPSILQECFIGYTQTSTLEQLKETNSGPVLLPNVQFIPKRIELKSKLLKNTFCNALYSVYSVHTTKLKDKECMRFILKDKHLSRETFFNTLPPTIKEATFDVEKEKRFIDFIYLLESIECDELAYWYSTTACEGYVNHALALIYQFLNEDKVYCVATVYFSIQVTK